MLQANWVRLHRLPKTNFHSIEEITMKVLAFAASNSFEGDYSNDSP